MRWIEIGSIERHPSPRRALRGIAAGRIAVFRTGDDQIFATEDRCPHKGGPLSQGIVHGSSVTCPLHNWVISLETGKAQGADDGAVRTIPVKVEGERFIAGDAAAGRAA